MRSCSSSTSYRNPIQKAAFFFNVVRAIDFNSIFKQPDCVKNLSESDCAKIREQYAEADALSKVQPGDNLFTATRKRLINFQEWVQLLAQVIVLRFKLIILNAENTALLRERRELLS